MPKHKKASSSDSDSDSGPDDRNPPPKKHAPSKSSKSKDSKPESKNDALGWHLGNNRFANVKEFKGKIMVNIREYYEKDGEMLPGKKGISLTAPQWRKFAEHIDEIEKQIEELA